MTAIKFLHESFLRELPELEVMAKAHFRHLDPEARDESLQNVRALTWKYWLRLCQQGRGDEEGLLRNVWWFAIRQTKVGRTIIRGDGKRGTGRQDVYDRTHGKDIEHIDLNHFISQDTPVPDQVAFRLDTPIFLAKLTEKQRRIALMLAEGLRTGEIAKQLGVTPAVISQCKARFKELYDEFFADAA
jgi:hypothetical protein